MVKNFDFDEQGAKSLLLQGVLTYGANGQTNVPMYAYADRLLVFGAFLPSADSYFKQVFST